MLQKKHCSNCKYLRCISKMTNCQYSYFCSALNIYPFRLKGNLCRFYENKNFSPMQLEIAVTTNNGNKIDSFVRTKMWITYENRQK